MDLLAAVDLLGELPFAEIESLLPRDAIARSTQGDVPRRRIVTCFVVAGCDLSGQLADCRNVTDLLDSFAHFRSLWNGGILSDERWSDVATEIFQTLEELSVKERLPFDPTEDEIRAACASIRAAAPRDPKPIPVELRRHTYHGPTR